MKFKLNNLTAFDWACLLALIAGLGFLFSHRQIPKLWEAVSLTIIGGFSLNVLARFSFEEARRDFRPFLKATTVLTFSIAAYLYTITVMPDGKITMSEGYMVLSPHPNDGLEYSNFNFNDEIYSRQKKFIDANTSVSAGRVVSADDKATREYNQDVVTLAVLSVLAERYEYKWRVGESLISERATEYAQHKTTTSSIKKCALELGLDGLRYMPRELPAGCLFLPLGGDIGLVRQEADWNELVVKGKHAEITIRVQVFPYDNPNPPYPAWIVEPAEFSRAKMPAYYYQLYVSSRFPMRFFPLWSDYVSPEDNWRNDIHNLLQKKFSDGYLLDILRSKALDMTLAKSAVNHRGAPHILHGSGL